MFGSYRNLVVSLGATANFRARMGGTATSSIIIEDLREVVSIGNLFRMSTSSDSGT